MSFIEFKDIENLYGQDSETWKDVLLTFGGVIVGFGLSELATLIRNNRQKNRIGRSFNNEIDALKPALINQVASNKLFINEISKYNFIAPTAFIYKNLDHVKSLDRLLISEYCKKQFGDAHLKKVRIIYNQLTIIESEMERLLSFYENYSADLSAQYDSYRANANKYSRAVADYFTSRKLKAGDDKFVDQILTLTQETLFKQKDTENIVQFQDSLHRKLIDIEYGNNGHPFYKTVTDFNQQGIDILTTITIKTNSFIRKVNTITSSLENCYQKIFDETIPEDTNGSR